MQLTDALKVMLTNLIASRKWMFTLVILIGGGILFAMNKISKDDLLGLYIGTGLVLATGLEKVGSASDGTVVSVSSNGNAVPQTNMASTSATAPTLPPSAASLT